MGASAVLTCSSLGSSLVLVMVGSPSQSFQIHRSLIMANSDFFRLALNGQWLEREGKVVLKEIDAAPFDGYVQYLYTGKIFTQHEGDVDQENNTDAEWGRLVEMYFLGDFITDVRFMNTVMDAIIEKVMQTREWPAGHTQAIYDMTPDNSPLRRLISDLHVYWGINFNLSYALQNTGAPKEFFQDVARTMVTLYHSPPGSLPPWEVDRCVYHDHTSGTCCQE